MLKVKNILSSILLLIAFVGLMFLSGCPQPQTRPAPTPPPNAVPAPQPGPNAPTPAPGAPPPTAPAPGAPTPGTPQAGSQEARRLAILVNRIPEIKSSSVIISGTTAIVGINLRGDVEGDRVNAIKAEVSRIVKRSNDRITNVSVTSDPDTVTRIRGVADGIRQGRPLSAFANELAEITRRLTPTTP